MPPARVAAHAEVGTRRETKESQMPTTPTQHRIADRGPFRASSARPVGVVFVLAALVALVAALAVPSTADANQHELAGVRAAVAIYHDMDRATADGWAAVPGLDHCFESGELGGMGYHLIDASRLDTSLDPHRPEALVYVPKPNGGSRLGAVEWIVPADAWDAEGHTSPPTVLGQHLHLNEDLGVYVLHAWIFERNPAGMFEDFNPRVSCP
jgi:hypothetical protein